MTQLAEGAHASHAWSEYLGRQMDMAVRLTSAAQSERTTSLLALAGNSQASVELTMRRDETDRVFADLSQVAREMNNLNPDAVAKSTPLFTDVATRLPHIRNTIDTRQANAPEVDAYFAALASIVVVGLQGSARHTPDSVAAAELMTTANLVQASDLQSRAAAAGLSALAGGVATPGERRGISQFAGAYRHELDSIAPSLTDSEQAEYHELTQSSQWRAALAGEDQLSEIGTLPMPDREWRDDETAVHTRLMTMFSDHGHFATSLAENAASRSLTQVLAAAGGMAVIAIAAFTLAFILAGRLVRRLRSLRSRSWELAYERLPAILQRIHDGEQVDLDAETAAVDTGDDEIGEVAYAFGVAQRTAIAAAEAEARTRDGFNKVFLDIAHRSQTVVRRQLDLLDVAESKQNDPEHLELLFRLDHLATRARRNAENLVILGGAQAGRRWRRPVPLEEIVRSAISETEDFARVSAVRLPQADILGSVVADLIHLLAELVDNAASFSPPQSPILVRGNFVGTGVAIEVEDQGLGIRPEERQQLNELLRNPPDFQEMALAGRRHLGLFVVGRLAQRHGVSVSLQESAYGGINAVVLIRIELLHAEQDDSKPDRGRPPHRPRNAMGSNDHQAPPPSPAIMAPSSDHVSDEVDAPIPRTPGPGRPPLPVRRRQTHLVPQLRQDAEPLEATPQTSVERRRAADVVRNSMASFQQGTRQARGSAPAARSDRIRTVER
ncbi:nitrate- and nitrite sensing domain-containing protein [Nocardia alni]|uniref:nitrate- and nitrite sensing domain-containing protein n=1 Tax=Nocardia alni TaxID=2815723 RepID=UPI001C223591|nr:nitrate- and nitrite sensing domain-containing protein [Nocardia alni]